MRFKIILIVVGVGLCVWGVREYMVSRGTSSEAAEVKLADLESGESPPNNYVKLDEHLAVYPGLVYSFRGRSGTEPGPKHERFIRLLSGNLPLASVPGGNGGVCGKTRRQRGRE